MNDLQERIHSNFLPMNLMLDPLQKILIDIMELIKEQSTKFDDFDKRLDSKAEKGSIDSLIQKVDDLSKEQGNNDRLNDLENRLKELEKLGDKISDIDKMRGDIENMKKDIEKNKDEMNGIKDLAKNENARNNEIDQKLKELLDKVNNNEKNNDNANNKDLEDELRKLKEKIEQMQNNINGIHNNLDTISEKMKRHGVDVPVSSNSSRIGSAIDGRNAVDGQNGNIQSSSKSNSGNNNSKNDSDGSNNAKFQQAFEKLGKDLSDRVAKLEKNDKKQDAAIDELRVLHGFDPLNGLPGLAEDPVSGRNSNKSGNMNRHSNRSNDHSDSHNDANSSNNDNNSNIHDRNISFKSNEKDSARSPRAAINSRHSSDRNSPGKDGSLNSGRRPGSIRLPDLAPADQGEALSQLRSQLMALSQNVQDNDNKTNQKLNEHSDQISRILKELADRPDRKMIERLFEKFKQSLNNIADLVNKNKGDDEKSSNYATLDDIKRLENLMRSVNNEYEEAAAARKSTCCLSCGRPYRTVTGAIQDEATANVLGAAPILHVAQDSSKPCFVYGSDHELYYSSSPRGKTFVAPPKTANGNKHSSLRA